MKTNKSIALTLALAALTVGSTFAETGTWTGADGATWNTSDTNWSGLTPGTPWDATNGFTNTGNFTAAGSASISGTVYANKLNYTPASGTFTLNNGLLNLGGTGTEVRVATGGTLTINSQVAGTLIKQGAGALNLTGDNTFIGTTYLVAGITTLSHNNAIGTSGTVYTEGYSSATALRLSGGITVSGKTLRIGGQGINNVGQLNVNDGTTNTWAGSISVRGVDGTSTLGTTGNANSRLNITGGIVKTDANAAELRLFAQLGTISVTNTAITLNNANDKLHVLGAGVVRLGVGGNTLRLLQVKNTGTLFADIANAFDAAAVLQVGTTTTSGTVNLNGYSQAVGGLRSGESAAGDAFTTGAGNITSATAATLTVNQTTSALYAGTITGAVALTKNSGGTLTLSGTNTYTGNTTINAGTLLLESAGSIANSKTINVASGATLNVSAVSGYNVGASQTLMGNGTVLGNTIINGNLQPGNSPGLLTVNGTLTLNGTSTTTMEIAGSGVRGTAYDAIDVTSSLAYGGNLTLAIGTTFGAGTYSFNLFDFASQSGSFAPGGVTLTGNYTGTLVDNGFDVWGLTSGNDTWTFTQSDGVLGLTVIPEPKTWALLAGSLTALMVLRRRRSS